MAGARARAGLARWVAIGVAAVLAATCAQPADEVPDAWLPAEVVYVYDDAGRLRAVTDPDGETAVYSYDEVGNIVGVDRHPSAELSVVELLPRRAPAGSTVTVHGTGFDDDPDDNTVRFGDAVAEVTDGGPFRLTVTVPDDADVGEVDVTVAAGDHEATSATAFAVSADRPPVIDSVSPDVVAPGDAVTVEGEGFTGDRLLDHVAVGGVYATVEQASTTELVARVPPIATSGRLSVATPYGTAKADGEVQVETDDQDDDDEGNDEDDEEQLPQEPADAPDEDEDGGGGGAAVGGVATDPPGGLLDGAERLPVDLSSGSVVFRETDLVVDDVVPLGLTRGYRSTEDAILSRQGGFGVGSPLEFDMELDTSRALQFADLQLLGGDVTVPFERASEGTDRDDAVFVYAGPATAFQGSRIVWGGAGWELRMPLGSSVVFEESGALREVRDRNGNALVVHREDRPVEQGGGTRVAAVYSPTGRWIVFGYDDRRHVVEARNHLGDTVTYGYDADRLVRAVYSPGGQEAGSEVGYGYDELGRITAVSVDGTPLVTVVYDEAGRVAEQRLGDGSRFAFAYRVETRQREIEGLDEPFSEEVVVEARVTDPAGAVRRVTFESGRWTSDTRALGMPAEQRVAVERDPETGFVTAVVNPDGRRISYGYDEAGNVTSVRSESDDSDDGEVTTELGYDGAVYDPTRVTDPAGRSSDLGYDAAGNLVGATTPDGVEVAWDYDDRGRLTRVVDAEGNRTSAAYELAHRVTLTDPSGATYSQFFDAAGRLVAVTDPGGATTRYGYDALDRVVSITDPQGAETGFTYDRAGNLAALADARGNTTRYGYDAAGRVTSRTDPDGAADQFRYDAAGNLVAHVDRRGVRSQLAYDPLGRPVRASYGVDAAGQAESTVSYRYDAAGRLTQVDDSSYGTIRFGYDPLGRLVSETTPAGEITYRYDAAGQRTSTTLPDGTETTYGYDDAGLLAEIRQGDAAVSAERDALGRVDHLKLPNDISANYRFDRRGLVRRIDYDGIKGNGVDDGLLVYGHDPAGRRREVKGDLARPELPDPVDEARHGANNQLQGAGDQTFTYDEAGNLVTAGTNTYTWDARGRLVAVDGEVDARFAYDPFGRRVEKTIDGHTTTYLYDGANVAQTTSDDTTATYLTGPGFDEIYARTIDGEITTYLTDGLGSVIGLAGEDGRLDTTYSYDPFGRTHRHGDEDPNPFTYTGRELDETGLHYYRARYYNAAHGRFISPDPLGFAGGDTNLYAYTANNPTNFTDPTGQQLVCYAALISLIPNSAALYNELFEVWDDYHEGRISNEEAQTRFDEISRAAHASLEAALLVCGIESLLTPTYGGLITNTADDLGTLGIRGRGIAARLRTRLPNLVNRSASRATTAARQSVGDVTQTAVDVADDYVLPAALRGGPANVDVYLGVSGGQPVYAGITNDVGRRALQHGARFEYLQQVTLSSVTRGEARAIEQALIARNPGFQNLRNSISPRHPWYQQAVDWGERWLRQRGL